MQLDDSFDCEPFWMTGKHLDALNRRSRYDFFGSLAYHLDLSEGADFTTLLSWSSKEEHTAHERLAGLRFCHHCQKLVAVDDTVECGRIYKPAVRKTLQPTMEVEKGLIASLWCKFSREGRASCPRIYCKFCLTYNYDEKDPLITGRFTCPACKVADN